MTSTITSTNDAKIASHPRCPDTRRTDNLPTLKTTTLAIAVLHSRKAGPTSALPEAQRRRRHPQTTSATTLTTSTLGIPTASLVERGQDSSRVLDDIAAAMSEWND